MRVAFLGAYFTKSMGLSHVNNNTRKETELGLFVGPVDGKMIGGFKCCDVVVDPCQIVLLSDDPCPWLCQTPESGFAWK